MAVRGYVLVRTEIGSPEKAKSGIEGLTFSRAKVITVDNITGLFDVIVEVVADDMDALVAFIVEGIQKVIGVRKTTTCLAINLR